mgnify:CR=1 FL=1
MRNMEKVRVRREENSLNFDLLTKISFKVRVGLDLSSDFFRNREIENSFREFNYENYKVRIVFEKIGGNFLFKRT